MKDLQVHEHMPSTLADAAVRIKERLASNGGAQTSVRPVAPQASVTLVIEDLTDDDLPNLGAPPADPKAAVQAMVERSAVASAKAETAEKRFSALLGNIAKNVEYLRELRADRTAEAAVKSEIDRVEGDLNAVIGYYKDGQAKHRVIRAFALAMVQTCPPSRQALSELVRGAVTETTTLPGLVELGLLTEIDDKDQRPALWASLPIYQATDVTGRDGAAHVRKSPISATFKVDAGDAGQGLTLALRNAAKRTAEQGREFFAGKRAGLDEAKRKLTEDGVVEVTKEEFRKGEHGCIVLETPDRTGSGDRFYAGGIGLYVTGEPDVNGKKLGARIVAAIGKFERRMMEIAVRKDRFVPVQMLADSWFKPGQEMRREIHADCLVLHQAIYHGLKAADEREAKDTERAQWHAEQLVARAEAALKLAGERSQYVAMATTGFVEGFMTKLVNAKVFVDLAEISPESRGTWVASSKDGDGKTVEVAHHNVFVVVEGNEAGHIKATFPERLAPLFGTELDEFKDPGEKFGNFGYPWRPFLKTCFANALWRKGKAEKMANRSGDAGTVPAEVTDEQPLVP